MEFEHLQAAAEKITLSEDAQRRILDLERKQKKRYGRRKFVRRSLAASCAAALLFAGFFRCNRKNSPGARVGDYGLRQRQGRGSVALSGTRRTGAS